jgi:hypothetical protein
VLHPAYEERKGTAPGISRSPTEFRRRVHAARSPAVTLAVAYIKDPKTSRRGGRPASGGADGEARPAADLASPSRCHKPPEESAASHRLWRHDARKLIADVHTYAPPTRGLQTCCCAEGHGEDHPLHHQEETDATCNLSSASRQVSKPPSPDGCWPSTSGRRSG